MLEYLAVLKCTVTVHSYSVRHIYSFIWKNWLSSNCDYLQVSDL